MQEYVRVRLGSSFSIASTQFQNIDEGFPDLHKRVRAYMFLSVLPPPPFFVPLFIFTFSLDGGAQPLPLSLLIKQVSHTPEVNIVCFQ